MMMILMGMTMMKMTIEQQEQHNIPQAIGRCVVLFQQWLLDVSVILMLHRNIITSIIRMK